MSLCLWFTLRHKKCQSYILHPDLGLSRIRVVAETPREILTTGSEVKINSAPDLGDLKTCTDNANLPPLPPVWVLQHCCEFCYQVMKVTTG